MSDNTEDDEGDILISIKISVNLIPIWIMCDLFYIF